MRLMRAIPCLMLLLSGGGMPAGPAAAAQLKIERLAFETGNKVAQPSVAVDH